MDLNLLKQFRRELHALAEISGNEYKTSEKIIGFLNACHPDEIITHIGGTGVLATWDSGKKGSEIIFRAELDALPIKEINTFGHRSGTEGVSHKCGHDGHMTIVCGVAQYLSTHKPVKGKVRLLFQPAEENGEGARSILADNKFKSIKPDFMFALHNLPGYPLHQVVIKQGTFTASVNSMIIHLDGKTAHAAEPENGINPALAVSQIIQESLSLADNHPEHDNMTVITPVYIQLGEQAYGISAGHASVHLTIRCWSDKNLKDVESKIETLANRIAEEQHLQVRIEYVQEFHANVNDDTAIQYVESAAMETGLNIFEKKFPFKWGEDFGLFTSVYKGCMFGLGSGVDVPALHNPDYDFPDELIETGIRVFTRIIDNFQKQS